MSHSYRVTIRDCTTQQEITNCSFTERTAAYEMVEWHQERIQQENTEIVLERIGEKHVCLFMQRSDRI